MTDAELRAYQADAGLVVDGILGPETRASLLADETGRHISDMIGFKYDERASHGLLIRCEGFRGRPYWPGGESGVTLDYGWDLAGKPIADFGRLYGHQYLPGHFEELCGALGLRGAAARDWLRSHKSPNWKWDITELEAAQILPRAAGPYWHAAVRACPALRDAPARVQTALLSVTYSAWTGLVEQERQLIEGKLWRCLAGVVRNAKGSRSRRELEAGMIEGAGEGA